MRPAPDQRGPHRGTATAGLKSEPVSGQLVAAPRCTKSSDRMPTVMPENMLKLLDKE